MDSEYIVRKILTKFFFDPRVPPGGVNFSMVKIFAHFVFFVMRTPNELRIYSLFAKFRQKIFSTSECPRVPLGVNFSIVTIFYNFVYLLMGTPCGLRIYCYFSHVCVANSISHDNSVPLDVIPNRLAIRFHVVFVGMLFLSMHMLLLGSCSHRNLPLFIKLTCAFMRSLALR